MGLRKRTDWTADNLAKERRFMERTAQLEMVKRPCEDCGGRGVDPGSLHQPEECPSCCGSGFLIPEENRTARKEPGRAATALPDVRATPLQVAPTPKKGNGQVKDGTLNDPYLRWLRRTQPCIVCGTRRGVESAHFGPHAFGKKAPAKDSLPICHADHRTGNESLHALGPQQFVELHELDIPALIARFNQLGKRFLDAAHRPGRMKRSPRFFRYYCCCGWKSTGFRSEEEAKGALERHLDRRDIAA